MVFLFTIPTYKDLSPSFCFSRSEIGLRKKHKFVKIIENCQNIHNFKLRFRLIFNKSKISRILFHNLGLGTKYVFLHVGWVQNLNLFLLVLILVSTEAT